MPRAGTGISKDDIVDADIVDAAELGSSGSTVYRTAVTVVSTTTGTRVVVISPGGLRGEAIPNDVPSQVGDKVTISGTAAAGTYTIESITNDTTLVVVEAIVTTGAGGVADFKYASGALSVGFDPTGTPTIETTVQEALEYALNNASGISAAVHKTLRQLIHLAHDGPFEGFTSGAYEETLPAASPFPTSAIWWTSAAKTAKIVEQTVTYNANKTINTDQYKVYDVDGATVLATVTDTYVYSGVFPLSRTRAVA